MAVPSGSWAPASAGIACVALTLQLAQPRRAVPVGGRNRVLSIKGTLSRARDKVPLLPNTQAQQMRWSQRGAHLLLQVRTHVLNKELRDWFQQWYPGMADESEPEMRAAA